MSPEISETQPKYLGIYPLISPFGSKHVWLQSKQQLDD